MVSSRLKELLELSELGREVGEAMVTGRMLVREEAEMLIFLQDKLRELSSLSSTTENLLAKLISI